MSDMPAANPATPQGSVPVCLLCGGALQRVQRKGFLQEKVLPFFTRFPWRCVLCNNVTYRTARHRRELRRQHGVME